MNTESYAGPSRIQSTSTCCGRVATQSTASATSSGRSILARGAAEVDQPARSPLPHAGQEGLREVERALQIDGEVLGETVGGEAVQRRQPENSRRMDVGVGNADGSQRRLAQLLDARPIR